MIGLDAPARKQARADGETHHAARHGRGLQPAFAHHRVDQRSRAWERWAPKFSQYGPRGSERKRPPRRSPEAGQAFAEHAVRSLRALDDAAGSVQARTSLLDGNVALGTFKCPPLGASTSS